jgi:phosphotransferase system HPr-like phosphotransfer protein
MRIISNNEFKNIIQNDLRDLASLTIGISGITVEELNRPMLGRLLMEAEKCEELIDAYGIKQNAYWYPLRKSIGVIRSYSRVAYNFLHLRYAAPFYQLVPIEHGFFQALEENTTCLFKSFMIRLESFAEFLNKVGLTENLRKLESYPFNENLAEVRLEDTLEWIPLKSGAETAVYLASSFLNLAEESNFIKDACQKKTDDYSSIIPDIINEEMLRLIANSFHNLQSKYDTILYHSVITREDKNLPALRGQISIVYHLLETSTLLIHYFQRHEMQLVNIESEELQLHFNQLFRIMVDFCLFYAQQYITAAQDLCQAILKTYSEQDTIKVPIPNYRGFHVRPSTLIAKIVIHYGSEVEMKLGNNVYNAAMPLELFRANEEINLSKRCAIAKEILEHKMIKNDADALYDSKLMKKILRIIFLDLLEKQKIIIYENDFSFDNLTPFDSETIADFAKRGIALYLALGKIDIISDTQVEFTGDKRVLHDIQILAEHGYGEDKFGNNIVLPKELSYLKR